MAVPPERSEGAITRLEGGLGGLTFTARLASAPFPYDGVYGDGDTRFFTETDASSGQRLHVTANGTAYPEHPHYDSDVVLFHVPPAFDPRTPFRIVVFFHQHLVAVPNDIVAGGVPDQITKSDCNVVLVAPQLARKAIDSSPGKLFRHGGTARLLAEAALVLEQATGGTAAMFDAAPVVLTSFSGGYKALAYSLDRGGLGDRVAAVLLLDGIFGHADMFAAWVLSNQAAAVFVTLHTDRCAKETAQVMRQLDRRGHTYGRALPSLLLPGTACFVPVATDHFSVLRDGPPRLPIMDFLRRLKP